MKIIGSFVTFTITATLVLACSKEGGGNAGGGKGPQVMSLRDQIADGTAWDQAFALAESSLGAPTRIDGVHHVWAFVEGDQCFHLDLIRKDDKVGGVGRGSSHRSTNSFKKCEAKIAR